MFNIIYLISFLSSNRAKEISSICKCEQLQKPDCDKLNIKNECKWDQELEICREFACQEYQSEETCNQKSCYWAGNSTKCLKKGVLCQQFQFDFNSSFFCQQIGCNSTNYNFCVDQTDCTEFTDDVECKRKGCYYDGNNCKKHKCSNYQPNQCLLNQTVCVLQNKVCRNKKCQDIQISKCDGYIVGNDMCHIVNSQCQEMSQGIECNQIMSQKACQKTIGQCKWNGTQCLDKECSDIGINECRKTPQLYTLGSQKRFCKLNVLNSTRICVDATSEGLNETNCLLNSERTYYYFQKTSQDEGQCIPCLIKLYNTWEMCSILLITINVILLIN